MREGKREKNKRKEEITKKRKKKENTKARFLRDVRTNQIKFCWEKEERKFVLYENKMEGGKEGRSDGWKGKF